MNTKTTKRIAIITILLLVIGIGAAIYIKNRESSSIISLANTVAPAVPSSSVVYQGGDVIEQLSPDAVPKEITDAVANLMPDFSITNIIEARCKTDIQDGDSEYRLKINKNGKTIEAQVDVDPRKNNKMDIEINERIEPSELPEAVVAAFKKHLPNLAIEPAEKRIESDQDGVRKTYRWRYKDPETRITISEDGKTVNIRQRKTKAQLPQQVIEGIQKALPDAQIEDNIECRIENGSETYRMRARAGNARYRLIVTANGEVTIEK